MNPNQTKRTSKFLSLVLRHQPQTIGIKLDSSGWVGVDELLAAINRHADNIELCLLYTSPSPRDGLLSRMPSSA